MKRWVNHKERYTEKMQKRFEGLLTGCPFCNCEPELARTHTKYWWVECPNCGGQSSSTYGAANAVKKWNSRARFTLHG